MADKGLVIDFKLCSNNVRGLNDRKKDLSISRGYLKISLILRVCKRHFVRQIINQNLIRTGRDKVTIVCLTHHIVEE